MCSVVNDAGMLSSDRGVVCLHQGSKSPIGGEIIAVFYQPSQGPKCTWISNTEMTIAIDSAGKYGGPPTGEFFVNYGSRWIKVRLVKASGRPWKDEEVAQITSDDGHLVRPPSP